MPKRPPSVPTQLQKFDEYPQVNSLNCTYSDEAHANRVYLYSTFEIFENGYNFISSISKNCRVLPQARNCMYKVLIKKKSDTLNLNIFFLNFANTFLLLKRSSYRKDNSKLKSFDIF